MEEEDEDDDEEAIPADEGRVGEVIHIEDGGEENTVPRSPGDRGSQPHGDETALHEDSICEDNCEEGRLRSEGIIADGYGESMRDLVTL